MRSVPKFAAMNVNGSVNRIRAVEIENIGQVTSSIRFFLLRDKLCAKARPGQFAMIWLPGTDEVPMSVLPRRDGETFQIALKPWGGGSTVLYNRPRGVRVGVRGPYGNGFTIPREGRVVLVGGGTGMVPLLGLLKEIDTAHVESQLIVGARSSNELPFLDEAARMIGKDNVLVTTDDGSAGVKGVTTDVALQLLKEEQVDAVYTCGPELMMRILFEEARKRHVRFEAAVEREFECGVGYCGSCSFGRFLVCKDGPVFDGERLANVEEFGRRKRNAAGKFVPVS